MKIIMKKIKTLSTTPLVVLSLIGNFYFAFSLVASQFSTMKIETCWGAGILSATSYGFIAILNFLENYHFINNAQNNEEK